MKPVAILSGLIALACAIACGRPGASPLYDQRTHVLQRIDYDSDRDGRVEARLFFSAGKAVRLEADGDADGLVDRWEFYRDDGSLARLGTSSQGDGLPDTWITEADETTTLDISTQRDGLVDRREVRQDGLLRETALDTNRDGRMDQWQRYEGGRLRELAMDTTLSAGRPDRRLVYGESGTVLRVEADTEGSGRFSEVPHATP